MAKRAILLVTVLMLHATAGTAVGSSSFERVRLQDTSGCDRVERSLPAGGVLLACVDLDGPVGYGGIVMLNFDLIRLDPQQFIGLQDRSGESPNEGELLIVESGQIVIFDGCSGEEIVVGAGEANSRGGCPTYGLSNPFDESASVIRFGVHSPLGFAGGVYTTQLPEVTTASTSTLGDESLWEVSRSTGATLFVAATTWQPGEELGPISHAGPTAVYVESGALLLEQFTGIAPRGQTLSREQVAFLPINTTHRLHSTGASPATFLMAGVVAADRDLAQPVPGTLAYGAKRGDHWDLYLHDLASDTSVQLTDLPQSDEWAPAFSHDNSLLAYLSDADDGTNQVWVMDADGQHQRRVTDYRGDGRINYVAWDVGDDAFLVTVDRAGISEVLRFGRDGEALGEFLAAPAAFVTTPPQSNQYGVQYAYVAPVRGELHVLVRADSPEGHETIDLGPGDAPNLGRDQTRVVFQVGPRGERQVEIASVDGSGRVALDLSGVDASNPVWSPDGQDIALVISDEQGEEIWIVPAEGGTPIRPSLAAHDKVWYLAWRR